MDSRSRTHKRSTYPSPSYVGFVTAMSRKVEVNVPPDTLKWAFRKFAQPANAAGTILVRDVVLALTEFGDAPKRMSMEDAVAMMQQVRCDYSRA